MNSVLMGDGYQNEQKAKITQIYHAELYLTLCDIPIVVVPQNCMSVIIIWFIIIIKGGEVTVSTLIDWFNRPKCLNDSKQNIKQNLILTAVRPYLPFHNLSVTIISQIKIVEVIYFLE